MERIDIRFSKQMIDLLRKQVNSTFVKFKADPFIFGNNVYGKLGIYTDSDILLLLDETDVLDYFGDSEDICKLEILEATEDEIISGLKDVTQVDTCINRKIKKIGIVQEIQTMNKNDSPLYELCFTHGLIFYLEDGLEISFEQTNPFVEDIAICQGYDLITSFNSLDTTSDVCEDGYTLQKSRYIDMIE